jgi:hypothetical protein
MKKIMKDKRIAKMMQGNVLFDGKRMIFGGFKMIIAALPQEGAKIQPEPRCFLFAPI